MKQEVEILFTIGDSIEKAKQRLQYLGVKELEVITTNDSYFYNKYNSQFVPDINGRLNGCLRLRKNNNNFITLKFDHFNNGSWLYSDEYETKIDNIEILRTILANIGFSPLVEVDSVKHIHICDNYEVVLEEVKNLGVFLEVEYIKTPDGNIRDSKQLIRAFAQSLNFNNLQEIDAGKPELLLKNRKKIAFLSFKYSGGAINHYNRDIINGIRDNLKTRGYDTYCSIDDEAIFNSPEFNHNMRINYLNKKIDNSDLFIMVILNNKISAGVMLELGYALARKKTILTIRSTGVNSEIEEQLSSKTINVNINKKINYKNIIDELLTD